MLAPPPLPRTLAACFRDLSSAKPEVRAHAAEELGHHLARATPAQDDGEASAPDPEHARGVEALLKALADPHPGVRGRAATALADARARRALPSLLVAVEDPDGFVRQMALAALGELGDSRASSKLRRALQDARPEVRYQAVIAFARVCPDEADAALLGALTDEDEAVRHIALRVLEERLETSPVALAPELRDRVCGAARGLLADAHADVAVAAAILLARLGDPRAKPKLLEVALGKVRGLGAEEEHGALEACGEIGLEEAIPALERRAYGLARLVTDTGASAAKVALAALGHARAAEELLAGLTTTKATRRDQAIVGVGRARLLAARAELERLAALPETRELAEEALLRLDQPRAASR